MMYSVNPVEVKKILEAKLTGQPYDKKQFQYYHLNRNYFNSRNEITSLRNVGGEEYLDNLGNKWQEQSTLKNYYHMPIFNWALNITFNQKGYSRKFLRDDNVSSIGGEFEIIVRNDGQRIDSYINESYLETYNYGRTRDTYRHKILDVNPHKENSSYTFKKNMGKVNIIE
ncbi:MAG: hypothetical protein V4608_13865 [Bacteroidota bacterium]